jgi:endonuclease/exonuclease/phosphatase family metal-dependent hydrolase
MEMSGDRNNTNSYRSFFPYIAKGKSDMVIFSRFPIKYSETIDFGPTNNSAMWADIDINGKMVRVFNVHLETTGFNRTLRKYAKLEMKGADIEENAIVRAIYGNYTSGMVKRAVQADLMAHKISESTYPAIVCGDFNDVPYSFTYNTMKGNLVDGFKECGEGLMQTFRGKKKVRIDYIFHDESMTGENYYKLDLSYSDHYPVFMKISSL